MAGYRHCFLQNLYGRADFAYGRVSGNDNLTKEAFRNNRNLNFRSDIFEVDLMAELWIKLHMKKGHQYNLKRVDAVSGPWNMRGMYMTIFGGVGFFHFNPKANFQGQWIALNPLRTEGQGLPNGPSPYRLNQFNIPVGMSLMFRLDKQWSFGIELTYRYTFTDYIDDTSTNYYDPATIAASNTNGQGEIAAYLSDPSLGVANGGLGNYVTAPGQQRGDPTDRDGYMYALLKVDYWVMNKAKFKPSKRPNASRRRR
jgi:hypothetical protein